MLPSFLFSSYKQYKTDSDAVATWLANTASRCGYPKDLLISQAVSQQKAPKLKGRARKLARDAARAKSTGSKSDDAKSKTTPEPPKYLIDINDFISLAEWIVKSTNPRVAVPLSLVSVLERAITVRKRHQDWWYSQSKKNDKNPEKEQNTNDNHAYFISILEKVREVLRPRMPTDLLRDSLAQHVEETPNSKETANGQVVNLFENLDMEEPSDSFLNSDSRPSGQKPINTPQAQYSVNLEPSLEEVYFAVHCLFNDFDNIRRYLQQVWIAYKQGAFDLVAASITTNTGIDFARRMQEDFTETFPKHTDFDKHINVLYVQLCLANGYDPRFKERSDDEMNFLVYEDAEPMLFPTHILLSSFNDIIEPGSLPMYKPGHYGVYDAASDRASKSSRDKFCEDKILLLEILPEFCILALGSGSIPAEDELTRGMREMAKQNKVPIWLTFAAQIYLDIHHTLREQISCGYNDLVKSAGYVENNITQVLKFHENLRIENWPKSNDQVLFQILDRITNWVNTDAVEVSRRRLIRRSQIQPGPSDPCRLLKKHPLYCGLLSYSIKALAQEASIVFVNAWGSVLYSAHLYNALRQETLISDVWADMDLALLLHRTEDMFIGGFPKTIEDYFRRFTLAMGYSATMFAKNRKKEGVTASKAGPRGLNEISPVSAMFRSRYCGEEGEGRTNLSPDDIEIILMKCTDEDDDTESEETGEWVTPKFKINVPEEPALVSPTDRTKPSKSQKRLKKTPQSAKAGVRPIQLLNALLNAIQSEMLELTFDHFRLHTFSWRLLRAINDELKDDLREIYGPGYLEKENQLPFVVGYIFMAAVQTSKLAGVLVPKKKDVVTSRLLLKAAVVLRRMLEAGAGMIELKMLKDFMGMEVRLPDLFGLAGYPNEGIPGQEMPTQ